MEVESLINRKSVILEDFKKLDYGYFKNGKKLRYKLSNLFCSIFTNNNNSEHLAEIGEMLHNCSLVHDDVIDQSSVRRNASTPNKILGNKKSVLIGDKLLAQLLFELTSYNNIELIKEMSKTFSDLVEGVYMELIAPEYEKMDFDYLIKLSINKTGSLIKWCSIAPLINNHTHNGIIHRVGELAIEVGILFQMIDDLLDFSSSSKKEFLLDIKNNSPNYFLFFLFKESKIEYDLLINNRKLNKDNESFKKALSTLNKTINERYKKITLLTDELEEFSIDKEVYFNKSRFEILKSIIIEMKKRTH